ncbi:ABC transporter ATP-binding protein, partial [Streptomyces decoyicus]|uniref:ABC transporter ATP-binding protein n=1 Tax=Streptomyces decoyicus TaxID=249567 RepID=UPI0033B4F545
MSAADTKHPGPQGASGGDGLSVTGLSVAYGTAQVLHEVSFDVAPGEILGIVGESGCGKSTLAYALGRHLAPGGRVLGGSVQVDGADVLALHGRPLRDWRARQLAVVHQDAAGALDPTMRIGAQLGEVLRRRGLSRAAAEERAVALLRRVRLPHPGQIARRYPHQLSGGQQQRVVIAAALAVRPRLLVLDEPTTGLDASVEHEVLGLLAELCTELRAATVFISHDLGLVGRLCDRVGVLYAGRLVELGEAGPVLEAPSHPYTSALLSSVPVLGVTRRESPLRPIPGRLPLPGEAGQGCSYAPRCPLAGDGCRAGEPALDEAAVPGRAVRCLRAGEPLPVPAVPQPGRQPSETASRAILEVRGLVRRYGDTVAVDQVDLTVRAGEVVGLVGESGSGKTTLARAVAGLGHGGAGRILLHGREVPARLARRDADTRRRVQMVFQNPDATLNPSHRVRTVLERAIATLADPEAHVDIGELTDRTHIDEELLAARPAALSGGQKQRVAIARSLAGHPDLVICDEPVSALDASVQAAVLRLHVLRYDHVATEARYR